MDPNDIQCSIDDPFSNNAVVCSGDTLPRSFTPADHGSVCYGFSPYSSQLSPQASLSHALAMKNKLAGFLLPFP